MAAKRTARDAFATPAAWSGLVAGSSSTTNWNVHEIGDDADTCSTLSELSDDNAEKRSKVDNIDLNKAGCKCAVEKQDKVVQVPEYGFQDGGQDADRGQYVGFDDAGRILYDVSIGFEDFLSIKCCLKALLNANSIFLPFTYVSQAPSKATQSSELWKNRDKYPMIDMGEFIMHPRNSSIVHDLSDPITVHVNTAEAIIRRGIRSSPNLPVISNLVEFNYIENKTLEKQFLVSVYWRKYEGVTKQLCTTPDSPCTGSVVYSNTLGTR